ncbi:hypothetical protein OA90_20290 [Labrenzia sp. OB1]|nr:hypothetical protein OA90_20290 [Labrenzia sp. OB1]
MPPAASPRDQIVSKLEAQVEAGEITSEDQDAMLDALDAMHSERMEAGVPDFSSGPPSKEEMQANFESMLADQVESGTLDQEQADQLAAMFESGELGGRAEGNPPPPPPGEAQQGSDPMEELMASLLETLQSDSVYNDSGEQSLSGVASMLADFRV